MVDTLSWSLDPARIRIWGIGTYALLCLGDVRGKKGRHSHSNLQEVVASEALRGSCVHRLDDHSFEDGDLTDKVFSDNLNLFSLVITDRTR